MKLTKSRVEINMNLDLKILAEQADILRKSKKNNINANKKEFKKSAVLILLNKTDYGYKTFLIKRAETGGKHSGQIAFPGGKYCLQDITLKRTALREAKEEIGINNKNIEIITKLNEVYIPVSKHRVRPYIAYTNESLKLKANPGEVEKIIEIQLKTILETNKSEEIVDVRGKKEKRKGYRLNGVFVWGATANIMDEFVEILKKACK